MSKILIANRGEIAHRIHRTCREQGHEVALVFSAADRETVAELEADGALCIGPGPSSESYLSGHRILSAALALGADALHPGYGFLSEDCEFARRVEAAGLRWIGPEPETLRLTGDKAAARRHVAELGLPVVPGSSHAIDDLGTLTNLASRLGYPVLVKASHGGGGRGMRIVRSADDLASAFVAAGRESDRAAPRTALYLERAIVGARHLEVQLLGDGSGDLISFAPRHCSIQRRHQKVIEESPAVADLAAVSARVRRYAERIGRSLRLRSAATVEFLVDSRQNVFFLEVNPRLQVEHGLTELVHGVDLVRAQLEIALANAASVGTVLDRLRPASARSNGHAIECRVNAEHSITGLPSPGRIRRIRWPRTDGIRVDSHLSGPTVISPHYDSLLGKLLAWGEDREVALRRMLRAIEEVEIDGIDCNLALLRGVLTSREFIAGGYDTSLLSRWIEEPAMPSPGSSRSC